MSAGKMNPRLELNLQVFSSGAFLRSTVLSSTFSSETYSQQMVLLLFSLRQLSSIDDMSSWSALLL